MRDLVLRYTVGMDSGGGGVGIVGGT